jgi:hypothetical protein
LMCVTPRQNNGQKNFCVQKSLCFKYQTRKQKLMDQMVPALPWI